MASRHSLEKILQILNINFKDFTFYYRYNGKKYADTLNPTETFAAYLASLKQDQKLESFIKDQLPKLVEQMTRYNGWGPLF